MKDAEAFVLLILCGLIALTFVMGVVAGYTLGGG